MHVKQCVECGAVLPDTDSGGLCSACTLKGALGAHGKSALQSRPPTMTLRAGTRLGPYEVLSQLGAGGMGEVYRARDSRLDRIVALKVLPGDFADDPERRERFEREARAASRLNHPHICTIHDIGEQDGQPYLVMELLKGRTLRERMQAGKLPGDRRAEDRRRGRRRARRRARRAHRPPRHHAGQHLRHRARRGEGARLRARKAAEGRTHGGARWQTRRRVRAAI